MTLYDLQITVYFVAMMEYDRANFLRHPGDGGPVTSLSGSGNLFPRLDPAKRNARKMRPKKAAGVRGRLSVPA
jgi:hypothetical protein